VLHGSLQAYAGRTERKERCAALELQD